MATENENPHLPGFARAMPVFTRRAGRWLFRGCSQWRTASLLTAGFWLAVVLIIAKAVLLGAPLTWAWPLELARISFRDVLFALALGGGGECLSRLATRAPRLGSVSRGGILALGAICALYGVLAYGVFDSFGRPLSFDLLMLVRNASAAKSSITDRITWPLALAMLAAPAGFLVASLRPAPRRGFSFGVALAMVVWVCVGVYPHTVRSNDTRSRRLALSPHFELMRSTLVGLTGHRRLTLPQDIPEVELAEYSQFGQRGGAARAGFQPPPQVHRPKNVIVVVLESVGVKYLSLYGSRYNTTPNLVAESKHALVFDHIYAHAPYTFCSFVAVNFSLYPGMPWCYAPGDVFEPDGPTELPPTLAGTLKDKGYRRAYMHNGDLDWGGTAVMLDDSGYGTVEDYKQWDAPPLTSWGVEDRVLFDRLIRWIDEKPGEPFLAYCWTDQTHNPYAMRPGSRRIDFFQGNPPKAHPEALGKYLNVVSEVDRQLGRLFAALRERGIADDTLVVVTGDHGEAFADPHEQRGHGLSVYEEEVHVPFMIWNPKLFPDGGRAAQFGGHVDLNPTVADLLGVPIPDEWQGYSLFAAARPDRTFFVASVDDFYFGIREGPWKYFFGTDGGQSLFDLNADPTEQNSVIDVHPAVVQRLRQRLGVWMAFEDRFLHQPKGVAGHP